MTAPSKRRIEPLHAGDCLLRVCAAMELLRTGDVVAIHADESTGAAIDLVVPAALADAHALRILATLGRGPRRLALGSEPLDRLALRSHDRWVPRIDRVDERDVREHARVLAAGLAEHAAQVEIDALTRSFPRIVAAEDRRERGGTAAAAVDLAGLAGWTRAAVLCRIIGYDAKPLRIDALHAWADAFDVSVVSALDVAVARDALETRRIVAANDAPGAMDRDGEIATRGHWGASKRRR